MSRRSGEPCSVSPAAGAGYTQLPLTLSFEGNYYSLTELIYRIRNLVTIRDGVLDAHCRLFTIDSLDWHEAEDGFPTIQADLGVSAYVYGTNAVPTVIPGTTPTPPADGQTTTTPATTTGATTTSSWAPRMIATNGGPGSWSA